VEVLLCVTGVAVSTIGKQMYAGTGSVMASGGMLRVQEGGVFRMLGCELLRLSGRASGLVSSPVTLLHLGCSS